MNKASDQIRNISDDVTPAAEKLEKAADALDATIDKAGKDGKYDQKEIKRYNKKQGSSGKSIR